MVYFGQNSNLENSESFCNTCKPNYSNKYDELGFIIMPIENYKKLVKRKKSSMNLAIILGKLMRILVDHNFLWRHIENYWEILTIDATNFTT